MSNEMNEAKRTAACVSDYLGTVATDEAETSVSVFDEWKKSGECHCKGKCTCGKRGPMGHFTKIEPIAEKVEGASDKVLKGLLDKAKKAGDKAKEDAYAHLLADSNDAKIAFVQYDAKKTDDLKDLLKSYKANVASSDEWVAWAKKNGKPDNMTQGDFDAFTVRQKDYGEQMQKHVDAIKRVLKMRGEKGYAQDEGEFKEGVHPRGSDGKFAKKSEGDKIASVLNKDGNMPKNLEATATFSLELEDGTTVKFLAKDEAMAKSIANGVSKKIGKAVKEVKMVEKPKITEDAHNLILGMETKDACKFISEAMSANVKGATRAETYLYDGGFNIEMDFPKMFGGDTLAKRDEIKAALGKIFPAALLKMNTRFGDNPFHTYQYSDSTRMSVKVPSYNSAKNDKEVAEKSVKFYEHECETFDKANAEGKYVKTNGEFQETVVSNTAFKNETARLWQERETYRVKGNLVSQKIRLISSTEFFGAVSDCYKGGEAAEKAVKAWNEKHNVKAFNAVMGEVALDEAEQENDEVAAFDEMETELQATFDEENGEITIPMTVAAFDEWDEKKHPRNHGKFAKKGEGSASVWNATIEDVKKILATSIRKDPFAKGKKYLHSDKIVDVVVGSTIADWDKMSAKDLDNTIKFLTDNIEPGTGDVEYIEALKKFREIKANQKKAGAVNRTDNQIYLSGLSDVELGKKIADVRNGKSKDDLAKLIAEKDRRYSVECAKMSDEELKEAISNNRKLVERYGTNKDENPYARYLDISEKERKKRGSGSIAKFRITEIHGKFAVEPNLPRFVNGKASTENIDKIVKGRKFFDKKDDAEAHLKKVLG